MTTSPLSRKMPKQGPLSMQDSATLERLKISMQKKLLKLESERFELKTLVAALKAENLRLQKKIAKSEANDMSAANRTKALEFINDPNGYIKQAKYLQSLDEKQLEDEIARLQGHNKPS